MGIHGSRITKDSNDVLVTVDSSKPTLNIDVEPKAVTVRSGAHWLLTVKASSNDANPIRYRWFKDGEDLFPQGPTNLNVYGEDHAQLSSTGVYTCRVSVGFGEDQRVSKMTTPVHVRISDDVQIVPNDTVISAQPVDHEVNYNGKVVLHTKASNTIGIDPIYQWTKDGVAIPGANSESLVIEHVTPSDVGRYQAIVTAAEKTITSDAVEVTLKPHSNIVIEQHPVDVVAMEDQKGDIVVTAKAKHIDPEKEVKYQWYVTKGQATNKIVGATSSTYTIPGGTAKKNQHEGIYFAEITDDEGHKMNSEKVKIVFTTAKLKRYVHPIPWRKTSFQYQGYWVMDEIDRCNSEGLNWLEHFDHTRYPDEIETIAASLHHYSNTHVLESRNGYLIDGTRLF